MPEVSIGMPVRNGARLLERALKSLLRQSFRDFELIISDNASTDATSEICQRFARGDRRIRYLRQGRNIGAADNFLYVLGQAAAPYFMWAAHDDVWEPDFIAANYAVLSTSPDIVLSVSQVAFVNEQGEAVDMGPTGTYALLESRRRNLLRYLSDPEQNSRYYGLHRTGILGQCARDVRRMWADDWLVMARTLSFGRHFEVNRCLLWRSPSADGADPRAVIAGLHKSAFIRAMPLLPYTWAALTDPVIKKTPAMLWPLLAWNWSYADQLFLRWGHHIRAGWGRLKRPFVKARASHDPMCGAATIQTIQRLLAEPLMGDRPAIERYSQRGDLVDCNGLLDIASDGDFVEAAYRQVLGREIPDKARRKWLRRLSWISRACMLARLRSTTGGRAHATRLPGLWRAVLLSQPHHGWLRLPLIDAALNNSRRKVVERHWRRQLHRDDAPSLPAGGAILAGPHAAAVDNSRPVEHRKAS